MLNPTQIGLAVGVVSVCCLMAFGGGVIAGMWYKASEQNPPYASFATLSGEAATSEQAPEEPPNDPRVTFYDTLKGKIPYTPLTTNAGSVGTTKTPAAPLAGTPPVASTKTPVANMAPGHGVVTLKTSLPAVPSGGSGNPTVAVMLPNSSPGVTEPSPDTVVTTMPVPASAPSAVVKPAVTAARTKATTASAKPAVALALAPGRANATKSVAAPAGTNGPAGSAKETAAAASVKETRGATDSSARRQAETPPPTAMATRAGDGQYSVQAGSFRSPEQAERLRSQLAQKGYQARVQLFTTPNNESWYRVRIGNFSDRTVAGQTAQTLASREQIQTVVANDPH